MPTPEDVAEAVRRLKAELDANGPKLGAVLDKFDSDHQREHVYVEWALVKAETVVAVFTCPQAQAEEIVSLRTDSYLVTLVPTHDLPAHQACQLGRFRDLDGEEVHGGR